MTKKAPSMLLITSGVLAVGLAASVLIGSTTDQVRQPQKSTDTTKTVGQEGEQLSIPWPWGDAPIAEGEEVPLPVVITLLRQCLCPLLPDSGPASPAHVDHAWANADGVVALEFDSGIKLAAIPDPQHDALTWISVAEESIAEAGWGDMVPLRGTQAMVHDRDEAHPDIVPEVKWVEGKGLITVAGHGPQAVDDLLVFANNLANPQIPE